MIQYTPDIWDNIEAALCVLNHMGTLDVGDAKDPDDGRYEAVLHFGDDSTIMTRDLNLEKTVMHLYFRVADALWSAANGKTVII